MKARGRGGNGALDLERKPTLWAWVKYEADNFFATNPFSQVILLVIITVVMIAIGGIGLLGVDDQESLGGSLWAAWTFVADPGTHAGEVPFGRRSVGVVLSLGGMLFFALLVGIISETIAEKVEELKKGKSDVLEAGHTVILGWSDKVIPSLRQLILANESEEVATVVVLAEKDKQEMDEQIATEIANWKTTTIITRTGSPSLVSDLKMCRVSTAKCILILTHDGEGMDADEADAQSVRSVLALASLDHPLSGHIVVEMRDIDNLDVMALAQEAVGVPLCPVVAHDVIGRVMIQCSRQPGLAQVFEHLLSFDGNELYIADPTGLEGMTFREAIFCVIGGIPIGIRLSRERLAREPTLAALAHDRVLLCPPPDMLIGTGDSLVVVAEDDSEFSFDPSARTSCNTHSSGSVPQDWREPTQVPESFLFLGWRRDLDDMITELNKWVAPGSTLTLMNTVPVDERKRLLKEGGLTDTHNLAISHAVGVPTLRRDMKRVGVADYDVTVVLADESADSVEAGGGMSLDSRSMVSMLLVRDLQNKAGRMDTTLIAEIRDPRTTALVANADCSDYVVSNELVSMVLTQVTEQADMNAVVAALFAEEGAELHIKPAARYVADGEHLSFNQLLTRGIQRREVVIGYRQQLQQEFIINPLARDDVVVWSGVDEVCVISED